MSWSFNFKAASKAQAMEMIAAQPVDSLVQQSVIQAVALLPNMVSGKQIQVISHGHVDDNGGNVNIMVSLVSL
jgi:hypothetical protein